MSSANEITCQFLIGIPDCTVGTSNQGQPIFGENGSNKGISGVPLFAVSGQSIRIGEICVNWP